MSFLTVLHIFVSFEMVVYTIYFLFFKKKIASTVDWIIYAEYCLIFLSASIMSMFKFAYLSFMIFCIVCLLQAFRLYLRFAR